MKLSAYADRVEEMQRVLQEIRAGTGPRGECGAGRGPLLRPQWPALPASGKLRQRPSLPCPTCRLGGRQRARRVCRV